MIDLENTNIEIIKSYKQNILKTSKRILKETHRNLIDYYNDNHVLTFSCRLDTAEQFIKEVIEINKYLEQRGEL